MQWIKFSTDFSTDEKIKLIRKLRKGDSLNVIWVDLLCLAGKNYKGGYIRREDRPYTGKELSIILNRNLKITQYALSVYSDYEMIRIDELGIFILNFDKHQSTDKLEKIQENNRERQKRYYEKTKKAAQNQNNLTLGSRYSNTTDIDKELDKELDKEYIIDNRRSASCTTDTDNEILNIFFTLYEKKMGKKHERLKGDQKERIYKIIQGYDYEWIELMKRYFDTQFRERCDYNANHFFTDGITDILYHEIQREL